MTSGGLVPRSGSTRVRLSDAGERPQRRSFPQSPGTWRGQLALESHSDPAFLRFNEDAVLCNETTLLAEPDARLRERSRVEPGFDLHETPDGRSYVRRRPDHMEATE